MARRRMRISALVWMVVWAVGLAATVWAAAPGLREWSPGESYAGEQQADPRLDQPVHYWRAAVTLRELFADLSRQTGVALRLSPGDTENPRVRVSVFLNKEHPPALRDLLVQLTWVVDCPFAVEESEGQKAYQLLSTSISSGVEEGMQRRKQAEADATARRIKLLNAKLEEYRQALGLSRAGAISRYRGRDDVMLLNLLDPARRAAAQFFCRHAQKVPWNESFPAGESGSESETVKFDQLTPQDLADLELAFGQSAEALRGWEITLVTFTSGFVSVDLIRKPGPDAESAPGRRRYLRRVFASVDEDFVLSAEDRLALLKALGEQISPEQEPAYLKRLQAEWVTLGGARTYARWKTERQLSDAARTRLATATLPFQAKQGYPIWRAQEATALATGFHVVSDAFTTGPVNAGDTDNPLALEVTERFCHARRQTDYRYRNPAFEWGDAGEFLRFRETNRDLWRAALLPQAYLDWIDSLLAPHLPASGARAADIRLTIDPVAWVRHQGQLSEYSRQHGAMLLCGDPHSLPEIARQKTAVAFLGWSWWVQLPFLTSLTDGQWARLQAADGLFVPDGITPEQLDLLFPWTEGRWSAESPHLRLKLTMAPADPSYPDSPFSSQKHFVITSQNVPEQTGSASPRTQLPLTPEQLQIHVEMPEQSGAGATQK